MACLRHPDMTGGPVEKRKSRKDRGETPIKEVALREREKRNATPGR
jgi:hypothetical protein